MRVLIVCRYKENDEDHVAVFIREQVKSLQSRGIVTDYFLVRKKGIMGYIASRNALLRKIKEYRPDVIHAHYGLSGLLANLQRQIPVVTTYHGSDINDRKAFCFSRISVGLSAFNIFVSQKNIDKVKPVENYALIPCGVDTDSFFPMSRKEARLKLGLVKDGQFVLFSGSFWNEVKNPLLAKKAVETLDGVELVELKGYSREEVVWLMNAVNAVLMTSFTEGSPQFIKEALACGCPVVSVDVGDVKTLIEHTEGCFLTNYEVQVISEALKKAIDFKGKTNGRDRIRSLELDLDTVARKIDDIYKSVVKK